MVVTATKKVEYVEFEHDGKELFAEAEFVIDIEVSSAAPYSGNDCDPTNFYVLLTNVTDGEGNEHPNVELREKDAEEIFEQSGVDLHEIGEEAFEAEKDDYDDHRRRSSYDD